MNHFQIWIATEKRLVLEFIKKKHEEGITTLIATHEIPDGLYGRRLLIKDGRLIS